MITSDASEVAGIFAENYEKLGRDDPPAGNTYDMAARARQDAQVKDILAKPIVRGPVGSVEIKISRSIPWRFHGKFNVKLK